MSLRLTVAAPTDLFAGVVPFVTTAELGSVRGAARALGITASAVSKSIARLEERLGVQLLARSTRRVGLTPEGLEIFALYRDAVARGLAARDLASSARHRVRGTLRVSVSRVLGRAVIAPGLPRLRERHPQLVLRLTLTDRRVSFAEEDVDVAVRIGELEDSDAHAWPLRETRWVTVASPAYVARRGAPSAPEELAGHDCLRFLAPDGRARDWTFADLDALLPVDGPLVADDGESLVSAAEAGLGVVQAMDFMVEPALAAGRLLELFARRRPPGPRIWALAAPRRHRAPNVRAFVEHLRATFARP